MNYLNYQNIVYMHNLFIYDSNLERKQKKKAF